MIAGSEVYASFLSPFLSYFLYLLPCFWVKFDTPAEMDYLRQQVLLLINSCLRILLIFLLSFNSINGIRILMRVKVIMTDGWIRAFNWKVETGWTLIIIFDGQSNYILYLFSNHRQISQSLTFHLSECSLSLTFHILSPSLFTFFHPH